MNGNQFIPKMNKVSSEANKEIIAPENDSIGNTLYSVSQYSVIVLFGLLPIFFTTGLWASLGFGKVLLTLLLSFVAIVSGSLLMLRRKKLNTAIPLPLVIFWLLVLAALASGLLSGDVQDSLRGIFFENQTVGFFAVMALAMSVPLFLQGSKIATSKALSLFGVSAILILAYNLLRLIIDPGILSFSTFGTATVSPIGGFNDLAIFSAMVVIFGLITLLQLPLRKGFRILISVLIIASLIILAIVNFFNVWLILCFFSFLMLLYLLSRDTIFKTSTSGSAKSSRLLIAITTLVCLFSVTFVVAGDFAGDKLKEVTGINYVEVRPSNTATIDIARSVYADNALLGIGPNKFVDAWQMNKNLNINQTAFWNTQFNVGSGFVPTLFVELGVLGGLLFILFSLSFAYLGYRMLLRNARDDFYWYYLGVVSFTVATFVWIMTYIYNPGTTILLIGALFTGLTFVSAGELLPNMLRQVPLVTNRKSGFLLMAVIILIIAVSVGTLFSVGKQYVAQADFNKAQLTSDSIESFEAQALKAYDLYPDDTFIATLARVKISQLNSLATIPEPTEVDQQLFLDTSKAALELATAAVRDDVTNPLNHALVAEVYNSLAAVGIDGAEARATEALSEAQKLDPVNPSYRLMEAQMALQNNNPIKAREDIVSTLSLKSNYTEALYLLAQLEIAEGNTESAISATQAIINLEPNNPSRYYQLGLLLSANNDPDNAIRAFKEAIRIDPDYANARYLLAGEYVKINQNDLALDNLKQVIETNPDNLLLSNLVERLEAGENVGLSDFNLNLQVRENAPESDFANTVTTDGETGTNLVSPVNTVSETEEAPSDINDATIDTATQ